MSKYKVGDETLDVNYPEYSHIIIGVDEDRGTYHYKVFKHGEFVWKNDFSIRGYDNHEAIRKMTKLDKALK